MNDVIVNVRISERAELKIRLDDEVKQWFEKCRKGLWDPDAERTHCEDCPLCMSPNMITGFCAACCKEVKKELSEW